MRSMNLAKTGQNDWRDVGRPEVNNRNWHLSSYRIESCVILNVRYL